MAAVLRDATAPPLLAQVSAYMLDSPTTPSVCVMGVDEIDYDAGGFSARDDSWTLIVEAALGRVSDINAQKILNELLNSSGANSMKAAIESDLTLTKRLVNGLVVTDQTAAITELRVTRYRGQQRFVLPNRVEVLLASWLVQVETSG